jgi:phosphoesterase RecJ-like protein
MHAPTHPAPPPDWGAVFEVLDRHQRFVVTTHVNPDGDGLGAELGLWAYLKSMGKEARILNPDALPARYAFLAAEGPFEAYNPVVHDAVIEGNEVVVVLDIARWERLAELGERLKASRAVKVCIDHHPFENNGMADHYLVDLGAAATGQLVYEMIRRRGHPVDRRMALGFYVSILTDTGSFRFSNTDRRAHEAAGELLELGVDPNETYENVYGNSSLERLRLLGRALSTMRTEEDGRLLVIVLPRETVRECGAVPADTEGFVDIARSAKDCEGLALLLERDDGQVKVSLRSRGRMNVNRVATALGGGGHVLASGATLPGPLSEAVERVLAGLRGELAGLGGPPAGAAGS